MDEIISKIIERWALNAPGELLTLLVIWWLIIRPVNRKISALSLYIKRFLAIQQRRAKGQEALAEAISALTARVVPGERKVRKTDYE